MTDFHFAHGIQCAPGGGHDRAEILDLGAFAVLWVADGAGGMSGAGVAADRWTEIARAFVSSLGRAPGAEDWCRCLSEADVRLWSECDAGETTAVVATVTPDGIEGASVGDSGAWLFAPGLARELTHAQRVRPFLGSGCAVPVPFAVRGWNGTLLLATDGLLRYADPGRLAEVAIGADPSAVPSALLGLVRLASGAVADDVACVLCRRAGVAE